MNSQDQTLKFYQKISPEEQKAVVAMHRHVFMTCIDTIYSGNPLSNEDLASYISGYQDLPDHIDTYAKVHLALDAARLAQCLVNLHKQVPKEEAINILLDVIQDATSK